MYVCIVFSMARSRTCLLRTCLLTLTSRRTAHFVWAGVALTNATDSSIAHIPRKKRKQIIEKAGMGERTRQNELKKARLEVRII